MQRRPRSRTDDKAEGPRPSFLPTNRITACYRCHGKKVKCSGGNPCRNCLQAEKGASCSYPQRNRSVKVPQSFIDGLLKEIDDLKKQVNIEQQDSHPPVSSRDEPTPQPQAPGTNVESTEHETQEPTSGYRTWFDNRNAFHTPILIGEAADAAFATRFRQVIADPRDPEPFHLLRVNYATDEMLMTLAESAVDWPCPPRARFLIDASLKYVSRWCFTCNPSTVMEEMTQILLDPTWGGPVLGCKFWALFALGELYTTRISTNQNYPGMAYFAQASKLLGFFEERPGMDSIETLLLLSIYSLALNRRYSAYILAGTAMRSAIVAGLHLNISESQLSDPNARERRKRLFWSVYIFDRMWGANLGHPAAIQNENIEVDLPLEQSCGGQRTSGDSSSDVSDYDNQIAYIKLAGHFSSVIQSVYNHRRPHQDMEISTRVHNALQGLQAWMDQLPPKLQFDKSSTGPNDLRAVSIHLSFHQCVILATRPILLHMLRVQVTASRSGVSPPSAPEIPAEASALSEACIQCARRSTQLLIQTWIDGSFVTFDCFFTQYLFSSLTVLAISSILDGKHSQADRGSFEEASRLLKQLKAAGNHLAHEYCHHIHAIGAALNTHAKSLMGPEALDILEPSITTETALGQYPQNLSQQELPIDTDAWTGHSLQRLLSQPVFGTRFLEDAVRDCYSQSLYQFDMNYEY